MEHKTYSTADKSSWLRGPWDDEPDKEQFADPVTGLPCLIVRNRVGSLCGYVGVTEGHPWFGVGYDDARTADGDYPEVHGGLTFASFCQEEAPEAEGICHVPGPGEPDRVWWLGFDTAHAWDLSPGMSQYPGGIGGSDTYKDIAYVKAEIAALAAQAAAVTVGA